MARRWWALVAVSLATFMTYLDNNVTNVAIPTIQRDLHLSISGLEWVVSSYVLVFAGLLLAGGRVADVFGRRRLFFVGHDRVHARLARRRTGGQRRRADRRQGGPGSRRRAAGPDHARDHHGDVQQRA